MPTARRHTLLQPHSRWRLATVSALSWLLIGGCSPAPLPPTLVIRGLLVAAAPITLPAGTMAVVELRDEDEDRVLTEQRQPISHLAAPWPFELQIDRAKLKAGHRHTVRGALLALGWAQWLSAPVTIDIGTGTIDLGALALTPAQRPLAFQSTIRCGPRLFTVGVAGASMRLISGADQFDLRDVPSASGSRLAAVADPSTYVDSKGDRATLSVRGQIYSDCEVLKPGREGSESR